jgi:hypothetical protein
MVKLFLCLIKQYVTKTYGWQQNFLAVQWLDLRPSRFKAGEMNVQSPLDRSLGGSHSRSSRCGEMENLFASVVNQAPTVQSVVRCYTIWANTLKTPYTGELIVLDGNNSRSTNTTTALIIILIILHENVAETSNAVQQSNRLKNERQYDASSPCCRQRFVTKTCQLPCLGLQNTCLNWVRF